MGCPAFHPDPFPKPGRSLVDPALRITVCKSRRKVPWTGKGSHKDSTSNFPRASRAILLRRYHKWPTSFLGGGRKKLEDFPHCFCGLQKIMCFFGFNVWKSHYPWLEFSRKASSQVSMAAEMDSAPQGICHDENHHFLFEVWNMEN